MKIPLKRKVRRKIGCAAALAAGCALLPCAAALALPSVHDDFWDTTGRVEPAPAEGATTPLAQAFSSEISTSGPRDLDAAFSSVLSTMREAIMLHRFTSFDPTGLIFIYN